MREELPQEQTDPLHKIATGEAESTWLRRHGFPSIDALGMRTVKTGKAGYAQPSDWPPDEASSSADRSGLRHADAGSVRPHPTTARIKLRIPAGGLVIDTSGTYVANPGSRDDRYLGPAADWQAIPPDASSHLTLTGCSIITGTTDTIDVAFSAAPPPGFELHYARQPTLPAESDGGGNIRGPRGLIRNDVSNTAPGGATPDYDWLVPTRLIQGA